MTPQEKRAAFPMTHVLCPFYKVFMTVLEPVFVSEQFTKTYLRTLEDRNVRTRR